jgi:putative DNA primase/helicase
VLSFADLEKRLSGIVWLWPGHIPKGMVTLLIGQPGDGKSAFALGAIARAVLKGEQWPDRSKAPKAGKVLWYDTEHAISINVQRTRNWGLPASRLLVPDSDSHSLDRPEDTELLERMIRRNKLPLVIIDSLRGSHGQDENNSKVGEVLKALAGVAERTGAAVVVIHHTKKMAVDEEATMNSSRGSNAIAAFARVILAIDNPSQDKHWRRIRVVKNNLAPSPEPLGFRVTNSGLEIGPAASAKKRIARKLDCAEWLRFILGNGPLPATEVEADATCKGFAKATLRRAREYLGIKPRKTSRGWKWSLPETNPNTASVKPKRSKPDRPKT